MKGGGALFYSRSVFKAGHTGVLLFAQADAKRRTDSRATTTTHRATLPPEVRALMLVMLELFVFTPLQSPQAAPAAQTNLFILFSRCWAVLKGLDFGRGTDRGTPYNLEADTGGCSRVQPLHGTT